MERVVSVTTLGPGTVGVRVKCC